VDFARARLDEAGDQAQRCGLAAARRAEQADRWPCSMASETSSTTATSPYRLVRLRNSTDATPILPLLYTRGRLPADIFSNSAIPRFRAIRSR